MAHILSVGEDKFCFGREIGLVSRSGLQGIDSHTISIVAVAEGREVTLFFGQNGKHLPANLCLLAENAPFERTPFDEAALSTLKGSVVVVFGSGTGGSLICLELARAGVGEIRICDFDVLKAANTSRHEGDFTDTGRKKTRIAAERVRRINPNIKVRLFEEDLLNGKNDEKLEECLDGSDVAVDAMDSLDASLYLNRETYLRGIPAVFGGCYEEALGGEVFFTLPEEDTPCMECLRGGLTQPEQSGEIDYSTASGPEDYEGEPGLHAAVNLVTTIEIQVILGLLLQKTDSRLKELANPRLNYLLIGGGLGTGFYRFKKPFDIHYLPLKGPRSDCDTHRLCRDTGPAVEVADDKHIEPEIMAFLEGGR